jgi:ribonuclease HII
MPRNFQNPSIQDSKKLSERQRLEAINIILKNAVE